MVLSHIPNNLSCFSITIFDHSFLGVLLPALIYLRWLNCPSCFMPGYRWWNRWSFYFQLWVASFRRSEIWLFCRGLCSLPSASQPEPGKTPGTLEYLLFYRLGRGLWMVLLCLFPPYTWVTLVNVTLQIFHICLLICSTYHYTCVATASSETNLGIIWGFLYGFLHR